MSKITIDSITKTYPSLTKPDFFQRPNHTHWKKQAPETFFALNNVSLEIASGQLTCFLGPSGSGKSTLLRIIAGLECQDQGRIWFDDREISTLPPAQRDIGIVFQSYALFPNLTAEQNIAYGLVNQRLKKDEISSRVRELLMLMDLTAHRMKLPNQLSGGQQQRVALARSLALKPAVLLLDEPLSALDAQVRCHLRGVIKNLKDKLGVTTIMVTHDQEEALTMADQIVVINEGEIEQVGTPEKIYQAPNSKFVADFLGKMNFLPAVLSLEHMVRLGDHEIPCRRSDLSPGTSVMVAFRPEQIELNELGILGQVSDLEYLGSHYLAGVVLKSIARRIEIHIPAHQKIASNIKVGAELCLGISGKAQIFANYSDQTAQHLHR